MTPTKTRYHLPELDDHVAKEFEKIKQGIVISGVDYGIRNLPPPDSTNVKPYYEEHHLKFQGLIDEVNRYLQIKSSIHEVTGHEQATENQLREVYNQQSAAKEKGHDLDARMHG